MDIVDAERLSACWAKDEENVFSLMSLRKTWCGGMKIILNIGGTSFETFFVNNEETIDSAIGSLHSKASGATRSCLGHSNK